jgi:uncharacterized membrane protein YvbJ
MKCKNCENKLTDNERFCTSCGFRVEKEEGSSLMKDTIKSDTKFGRRMLNFLGQNWFKVCILILISIFILLLITNGIEISVDHSSMDVWLHGDVNTGIDGATLYVY